MVSENMFTCTVTGKKYFVKGELHCNSCDVIYLVGCSNCKHQYIGFALNFKQWLRIHKSDIKTNKNHCGTARHCHSVWCPPSNAHFYFFGYSGYMYQDHNFNKSIGERTVRQADQQKLWLCLAAF